MLVFPTLHSLQGDYVLSHGFNFPQYFHAYIYSYLNHIHILQASNISIWMFQTYLNSTCSKHILFLQTRFIFSLSPSHSRQKPWYNLFCLSPLHSITSPTSFADYIVLKPILHLYLLCPCSEVSINQNSFHLKTQ